jgi:hypothetical protein
VGLAKHVTKVILGKPNCDLNRVDLPVLVRFRLQDKDASADKVWAALGAKLVRVFVAFGIEFYWQVPSSYLFCRM